MNEVVLEVKNLTAAYQKNTVLRDVNFQVEAGSLTGIVGPNGAG
ncbi:MAG: manganese ABC transporter ATP-binding protein, partial [Caldibacillus thermoamylovorans]